MFRTISWVERSRSSVVMMSIPPPRRSHCSPIWEYADRSSVSAMPPPSLPDRGEAHDRLRRTRGSLLPEQQKDRPPEIRGPVLDRSEGAAWAVALWDQLFHLTRRRRVPAGSAVAEIPAGAAVQPVRTALTPQRIVGALASQVVASGAALDVVAAAAAIDAVLATLAQQEILATLAQSPIVTRACSDRVLAGPGTDDVVAALRLHGVVPSQGHDHVIAGGPHDRVVPARPDVGRRLPPAARRGRRRGWSLRWSLNYAIGNI